MSLECIQTKTPLLEVDEHHVKLVQSKMADTHNEMRDIECRLQRQLRLQRQIMTEQTQVMTSQDELLKGLAERLSTMSEEVSFNSHMCNMYDRLMDDHEQISRKVNLRLEGLQIPETMRYSPDEILKFVQCEVRRCGVRVEEEEYESADIDKAANAENDSDNPQRVILKMGCCLGRNEIFMNRNKLPFEVLPDLTQKREEIFEFAICKVKDLCVQGVVDQVFVDMDCKLKLKTKCGMIFGFSSREEFISLHSRLSGGDCNNGNCSCLQES